MEPVTLSDTSKLVINVLVLYAPGVATTSALLIIEHFITWDMALKVRTRYALGCMAIFAGMIITSLMGGNVLGAYMGLCLAGALTVWLLHRRREARGQVSGEMIAARESGEIISTARYIALTGDEEHVR